MTQATSTIVRPDTCGLIRIAKYLRGKVSIYHRMKGSVVGCGKAEKTFIRTEMMPPEEVAKATQLCGKCRKELIAERLIKEPVKGEPLK